MNFEGTPEPIDFDFFDEEPSSKRNPRLNSPDYNKPVRPLSGKRSNSARANDGEYDRDSVRSVTSSRSSVSVRIPTATPTHDDGNEADYYSDDFDDSDKDNYRGKDDGNFRFKEDIGALRNERKRDGRTNGANNASSKSAAAMKSRPKTSVGRRRRRSRSNSSSSHTSTDSASSSFTSESSRSSRSERDNESVTDVSPLQSPASSPIPKLEYDEQEMERETEKMRSVRFVEDETDRSYHRDSVKAGGRSGKGRPKSSKSRERSGPVKTPGYSNYEENPPMRSTEANELSMLLRAVLELDETPGSSELAVLHKDLKRPLSGKRKNRPQSAPMPHQRMNMSFSNDEVRRIDRENQRLLDRIVRKPSQVPAPPRTANRPASAGRSNNVSAKPTSHAAVRRQRDQRRIEIENMQILKRIEAARANPEVKKDSLLEEYHQQRQYAAQVSKTPGGPSSRPVSAKHAGKGHYSGGMAKASSMSSLGTDYTADTFTSSSTGRSRPRSAKWSGGGGYQAPRPAWDDRFCLDH